MMVEWPSEDARVDAPSPSDLRHSLCLGLLGWGRRPDWQIFPLNYGALPPSWRSRHHGVVDHPQPAHGAAGRVVGRTSHQLGLRVDVASDNRDCRSRRMILPMQVEQITSSISNTARARSVGPQHELRWTYGAVSVRADGSHQRCRLERDRLPAARPRVGPSRQGARHGLCDSDDLGDPRSITGDFVPTGLRFNEGCCDPDGRFYCGTMAYDRTPAAASLYNQSADAAPVVAFRRQHQQRSDFSGRVAGLQRHRHHANRRVRLLPQGAHESSARFATRQTRTLTGCAWMARRSLGLHAQGVHGAPLRAQWSAECADPVSGDQDHLLRLWRYRPGHPVRHDLARQPARGEQPTQVPCSP